MQQLAFFCTMLCLYLGSIPALVAQSSATEQVVYALFDKPEKVEWLKYFHGHIDGINEVSVSLAYDGKKCKGLLTYLRSREAIQLEGVLKNQLLDLEEINREGAISGAIKGEFKGSNILAEWTNVEKSISGLLTLSEVEEEIQTPSYCGDQMWIRTFQGQLPDGSMRLVVQKVEDNQLRGIAFGGAEQSSYRLVGEILDNQQFQLFLQSADYQIKGSIEGSFQGLSRQRAIFKGTNRPEQYLLLDLESHAYMGCVEYADYLSSYDITYPKTQHAGFNEWMEQVVDRWLNNCREYIQAVRKVQTQSQPPLRSSIRAYGWTDLDYYSPELISGFMTFHQTWTLEPEGQSFNYDLVQDREIQLEDIFQKDFEVAIFVLEYLHKNQLKYRWYQDVEYRKWLAGKDFPHFTIREEGLCFGTAFSPLYGRHELTIPYQDLKPYLKKKSPIRSLVERPAKETQ